MEALKLDFETVRASSKGVDRLLASIQDHIDDLTANITIVNGDLDGAKADLNMFENRLDQTDIALGVLNTNVADNRNGLVLADDQFQMLRLNSSTLKANILGLGNYINTINGDVGKLANTFESYISDMTKTMIVLADNVTAIETDLVVDTENLNKRLLSVETMTVDMKGEIASLTTKTYTMKTNVFEQGTEITALRADHENIDTAVDSLARQLKDLLAIEDEFNKQVATLKTDVSTLRTGMTSLTSSMFNIKTKVIKKDCLLPGLVCYFSGVGNG